jgi:hypothetical protein
MTITLDKYIDLLIKKREDVGGNRVVCFTYLKKLETIDGHMFMCNHPEIGDVLVVAGNCDVLEVAGN